MSSRLCVRTCCLALLLAVAACDLNAQSLPSPSTVIDGVVVTRGAGQPVPLAAVTIEGMERVVRTDSVGRFSLSGVAPGPHILVARRIGYAVTRQAITLPVAGRLTLRVVMATNSLQLDQLVVTADRTGRARGELGTASVIDRDAIANQVASSLQGILELVPGVPHSAPGLDAATPFALRALATGGAGFGAATGPDAASIGASGTLIILDGVPLSNNANLQTVGVRGETVPLASTAGSGIDLRRIPASTLDRVEVIRGIPSARWGDLTQGAIVVDTRASPVSPEFALRSDPRTREGNVVGGRQVTSERQQLTATLNVAETRAMQTLSNAATRRAAGQLAHRWLAGGTHQRPRVTADTRIDGWQLRSVSPERVDIEAGRSSFQDDRGLRLAERLRVQLAGTDRIEWTTAFDVQDQLTREHRLLGRGSAPFTDRLVEGRQVGRYLEGVYDGAYTLDGAPRFLYSRLEHQFDRGPDVARGQLTLRSGLELRREWNTGAGYQFAIDRPPQNGIYNGVTGYDRPRAFAGIPALTTSAAYVDARVRRRFVGMLVDAQAGARADALHDGGWWWSAARSTLAQPRLALQIAPRQWLRARGGVGIVGKLPTVGQLTPPVQYFDLVNVNRYTPDPRERLTVLTTFIRDPRNHDLGIARATKQEVGIEVDGGARVGSIALTWFDDAVANAVTTRRDIATFPRERFVLVDTGLGSGRPGRYLEPPIGSIPVPTFVDRYVNGGTMQSRGLEFVATLPVIPALRTRVEVSGAKIETRFRTNERDFGGPTATNAFQLDSAIARIPYYEGLQRRMRRTVVTWRAIHHQPDAGIVITGTLQQSLGATRVFEHRTDSLAFAGYVTRTAELVPVPFAERTQSQYADLRRGRAGITGAVTRQPDDWLMSLQIAKSIARSGRLSFYFFNVLDKIAVFGGGSVRSVPSTRFGAEMTLPTAGWWR